MQEQATMNGKVCLVTGATSGIGKETALGLARAGATVVITGRDAARATKTAREIEAQVPGSQVEYLLADFADLAQVRRLAAEFLARYPRLDVLVNNAGGIWSQREVTQDGFEMTFGVNHLAHFLLTNLLLDRLKASAPARIVNVSSTAHRVGRLNFEDLMSERRYAAMQVYGQAKLANLLFTYELARRLAGTGVTANALHPGVVRTNFGSTSPLMTLGYKLIGPFVLTPAQGAATSLHLAMAPAVTAVTGGYFARKKPARSSHASHDVEAQRRLWAVSERLVGL